MDLQTLLSIKQVNQRKYGTFWGTESFCINPSCSTAFIALNLLILVVTLAWPKPEHASKLKCAQQLTGRVINSHLGLKGHWPKQFPEKQNPPLFWWSVFFLIADITSASFRFGTGPCLLLESNIACMLAVTMTFFGDCFTPIRWELFCVNQCLSLTITVMPGQCPQCEYTTSTCISQVSWFREETSGLNGVTGGGDGENAQPSVSAATLVPPLKMVEPSLPYLA